MDYSIKEGIVTYNSLLSYSPSKVAKEWRNIPFWVKTLDGNFDGMLYIISPILQVLCWCTTSPPEKRSTPCQTG